MYMTVCAGALALGQKLELFLAHGRVFHISSAPDHADQRQRNGGAGRDRTDDLKLAKLPLSQLSYSP